MKIKTPKHKVVVSGWQGFTLVEVLTALALFAIGILAAYTMQIHSAGTVIKSDNVNSSSTWAMYLVEDLLALDYDDPRLENRAGDPDNGMVDIDATTANGGAPDGQLHIRADGTTVGTNPTDGDLYSVFYNIADDSPLEQVKQIRIIVMKNSGLNTGVLYVHDYYKHQEL